MPLALAFRPRYLAPASAAFLGCLFVLAYRGPFWRPIRAHGGDLLVVPLLCFLLATVTSLSFKTRAILVGALACGLELLQLAPWLPRGSLALDLTLGSTFDPYDLAAYLAGLGLAALVEPWVTPRPSPAPPEGLPR